MNRGPAAVAAPEAAAIESRLPDSLSLVDDDPEFRDYLAQHLRGLGVQVRAFADSDELLADAEPYRDQFFLVDLMLPGVDGVDLIRVLRRRSQAGILVVSGRLAPDVFESVINAGADMYLAKPASFEQIVLAIRAVHRRVAASGQRDQAWLLDVRARQLQTPDGQRIDLSDTDLTVMLCFVEAQGRTVSRETLCQQLGRPLVEGADNGLHATIYRLRRRIERATPAIVPLQSQSRVGYLFKAELRAVPS